MKQTFIAVLQDRNFNMVTFERFGCQKPATVEKQIRKLLESDLYRACIKGATTCAIYATPDGYTREEYPCYCFNFKI